MARWHVFEFEDQRWFPRVLRDACTAYLEFVARKGDHAAKLAPKVAEALSAAPEARIVDLGSGAAGPVGGIVEVLVREGFEARAVLTDLYPNLEAFARRCDESDGRLEYVTTPVDATRVPLRLRGLRTMFNAFHHLEPSKARQVLKDAVEAGQPIAVFELIGRQPLTVLGMIFLVPILMSASIFFLRPFRWSWLPLTYLVPVLPFVAMWDGLVSCFRVYSRAEMWELVHSLERGERYRWDIGELPIAAGVRASYLVGVPR